MRQEYRITYRREGGKLQYRTFQTEKNLVRYIKLLTGDPREELKPIVSLELTKRSVGPWYTHKLPDEPENLSHPAGMING